MIRFGDGCHGNITLRNVKLRFCLFVCFWREDGEDLMFLAVCDVFDVATNRCLLDGVMVLSSLEFMSSESTQTRRGV